MLYKTDAPRSDVLGAAALGVPIGKTNGLTLTYFTSRTERDVGGEFESLVLDAPMFKKRIKIDDFEIIEESESVARMVVKKARLVGK